MVLFSTNNLRIFKKRSHRQVVVFVLVTILHNFFIFPVHAADDTSGIMFSQGKDIQIIKSPTSDINLREQLLADNSNTPSIIKKEDHRSNFAKNFKIVAMPAEASLMASFKKHTNKNLEIASNEKNALPENAIFVTLTAYNSEVAQTDGDPCTTANGFNVCKHGIEDTVAANFLPMGTVVRIPDLFGDKEFVVRDRTSTRFGDNRTDVWMKTRADALQFGIRHSHIVVVK